jgi:hypothetical protein
VEDTLWQEELAKANFVELLARTDRSRAILPVKWIKRTD